MQLSAAFCCRTCLSQVQQRVVELGGKTVNSCSAVGGSVTATTTVLGKNLQDVSVQDVCQLPVPLYIC